MNLLRSEWIKLWTTRTTWVMLGIGLLCEGLFAGLFVGLASFEDIGEHRREIATGIGLLMVLMLVLGVLIDHHRVPPRHRQLDLPRLAAALAGAGRQARRRAAGRRCSPGSPSSSSTAAWRCRSSPAAAAPCPRPATSSRSTPASSSPSPCSAPSASAIGAIVRNQVGAIIAAIAFFFVLSPLPELLPGSIGEYFPAQAVGTLHGQRRRRRQPRPGRRRPRPRRLVARPWSRSAPLLICRRDVSE